MSKQTENIKAAIAVLDLALSCLERAENEAGGLLCGGTDRLEGAKLGIGRAIQHLLQVYDRHGERR